MWSIEHPWMTFFIALAILETIQYIFKYATGYKETETIEVKTHCECGYPLPPKTKYIKEGSDKEIFYKAKYKCPKCLRENIY